MDAQVTAETILVSICKDPATGKFAVYKRGQEFNPQGLVTKRRFRIRKEAGAWCSAQGYVWTVA